jgi:hypothetical protein
MRERAQADGAGSQSAVNISGERLASQRLTGSPAATPADLVRWMGAIQAQDFLGSLWAIGCRLPDMTEQRIEQAIAERTLVRTWPMRGTVHLVAAEDARWMLNLMAPRVIARSQRVYRQVELDAAVFARSRAVLERTLAGGQPVARGDLYALLEAEGIATANTRGLHIVGRLAQDGLICFGPREGKQPTFVLLDEWAPNSRTIARDEALAEIVLRYFRSHGPATIADFTWWSGLTASDARAGLAAVAAQLIQRTVDGSVYWSAADGGAADTAMAAVHLLPPFDEYVVSYKDRGAVVDLQDPLVGPGAHHLGPIIVSAGQVVGRWKRTLKKSAVELETTHARPLTDAEQSGLEAAARRYGEFLGLPAIWCSAR